MSAMAPNPQTEGGIGGAANDDWSAYYLPQTMGGLPDIPTGPQIDSTYLAAEAQNRQNIEQQYGQYLSQLGYTDPTTGAYIPGSIVQAAQQKEDLDEYNRQQAILQNTQQMQQQGTLFSGIRATQQAQAEAPYLQDIASQELQAPQDMAKAYSSAADLINQYNTQNNIDLAAAAARYTAQQQQNPTTPAPAPAPAPAPSPAPSGGTTGGTQPMTGMDTTYWATPYYAPGHSPGVSYMAQGGEVDGPTPAVIGEQGPEAVVPMSGLLPHEQDAVHGLIAAARARMGGANPPTSGGIHWFGPGGSGIAYPQPGGPIHLPEQPITPGGLPFPPVHFPPISAHPTPEQWMAHHSGVMSGRVGTGYVPHWAKAAVLQRLRGMFPPVTPGPPPVGIPNPGISPQ